MTLEDIRYTIQQSYKDYSDEELMKMVIKGHYASSNRDCNEGFYAAEELITRLQKKLRTQE